MTVASVPAHIDLRAGSFTYGPSRWHRVDLYRNDALPIRGRAVVLHGGFWRHDRVARELAPFALALAELGTAVAVVEYRPSWDGGAWPGAVADLSLAESALRAREPEWSKAVLVGHSAGAHLAVSAATGRGEGRRVIALAPVVDVESAMRLEVGGDAVSAFLSEHVARNGSIADANPQPVSRDIAWLDVLIAGADQAVPEELISLQVEQWTRAGLTIAQHTIVNARHMHLVNPQRSGCATVLGLIAAGGSGAAAGRSAP